MLFRLFKLKTNLGEAKYFLQENDAYALGYRDAQLEEIYAYYDKAKKTVTELALSHRGKKFSDFNDIKVLGLSDLPNGFYEGYHSWNTTGDTEFSYGRTTETMSLTLIHPNTGFSAIRIHVFDDLVEIYDIRGNLSLSTDELRQAEKIAAELLNKERARQSHEREKNRLFKSSETTTTELINENARLRAENERLKKEIERLNSTEYRKQIIADHKSAEQTRHMMLMAEMANSPKQVRWK